MTATSTPKRHSDNSHSDQPSPMATVLTQLVQTQMSAVGDRIATTRFSVSVSVVEFEVQTSGPYLQLAILIVRCNKSFTTDE